MRGYVVGFLVWVATAAVAQAGTLSVTGNGVATGVPDMATISMGVQEEARDAQDAMDMVAIGINAVLASLETAGIEAKDVQTSQISLYPIWNNGNGLGGRKVTGFTASVSLSVMLRDLDNMGAVLAEVVAVGGNRFQGVSLGFQDTSAMEAEARGLAVADARMKAEQLANAAGVALGDIVSISEGGSFAAPVMQRAEMAMMADTMQIARGESSVSQSVTMVFEID